MSPRVHRSVLRLYQYNALLEIPQSYGSKRAARASADYTDVSSDHIFRRKMGGVRTRIYRHTILSTLHNAVRPLQSKIDIDMREGHCSQGQS